MAEPLDLVDDRRFAVTMRSTSEAVRQTLSLITTHFTGMVSEPELATLELVLAETLNNVVEHAASPGDQGEAKLRIAARRDGLACTILDNGLPMPGGRLPKARPPRIDTIIQDLPEGGFGWALIRMHVRKLQYQRKDGMNILQFVLPKTENHDN
jgi:serine/threonine-protein kinase RsbW